MRKEIEKKVNISFVAFIAKLKASKIDIAAPNKETIAKLYHEDVGLAFSNLARVSNRVERKEIAGKLDKILVEHKLSREDFVKQAAKLRGLSKKQSSVYA